MARDDATRRASVMALVALLASAATAYAAWLDDRARKLTTLGVATVLMALLGGCGGDLIGRCYTAYAERHGCQPWRRVLTNYQGEQLDDQQIAILKPGDLDPLMRQPLIKRITSEDDAPVYDFHKDGPVHTFKLTPGTYLIDYSRYGTMIPDPPPRRDLVQLRPGHTYLVDFVRCWFHQSQGCGLLIKDETTDQIIAGGKGVP